MAMNVLRATASLIITVHMEYLTIIMRVHHTVLIVG